MGQSNAEQKRQAILQILEDSKSPLSGKALHEELQNQGFDISERTIRFHLNSLDKEGITKYYEKKGRSITTYGRTILKQTSVYKRIGFLSTKIDKMIYLMDYNYQTDAGQVLINLSLIDKAQWTAKLFSYIRPIFEAELSMGTLVALFDSGELISDYIVPEGKLAIATVCSISLNGVLLNYGIPTKSIFGGLIEIKDKMPRSFTELIKYDGSSLDPLEIFISGKMTSCYKAGTTGSGIVGVSLRQIPSESRNEVIELNEILQKKGLGGILVMGYPGTDVLGIPIEHGSIGLAIAGGLNAMSGLVENGVSMQSLALAALIEYKILFHYSELPRRIADLLGTSK